MDESERNKQIFASLQDLTTEQRNPRTRQIDLASTEEILELLNREEATVAAAVKQAIPDIAKAADLVVESFAKGGRLFYVGAGTSGRLGVLDAAECPPTFGVEPGLVTGLIAGGRDTVFLSKEGIEDDDEGGINDIVEHQISAADTVIGITASRRTPYVIAALEEAARRGGSTVFLSCNEAISLEVDVQINIVVGPEAITGSTRLKSGTATKMALNMITTAAMVKLGKVYENLMVDLKPTSEKLIERAKGIIMIITGIDYEAAAPLFERSGRNVKVAVVMEKRGVTRKEAERMLEAADGFLARALGERS
jgi:N-acetylmuramic acid 6-phosphate etherase